VRAPPRSGAPHRALPATDVTQEAEWDQVIATIVAESGGLDITGEQCRRRRAADDRGADPGDYSAPDGGQHDQRLLRHARGRRGDARGGPRRIDHQHVLGGGAGRHPRRLAYAASKAGLRLFGKAIAMETAKEGIRVNSVHPGMILTGMQSIALQDNPEQFALLTAGIPMGRMGDPIDIANMILFLASDEARYITGAEFVVDGGMTAQ
jgi:NAD(P)-dependent dehydrogenase (short-subunit alcohol dehydrogenase family)